MNCNELESFIYPYLDGEFDETEKFSMEQHLSQCASCSRRVHEERKFQLQVKQALLQESEARLAPASLRARVVLGLAQERRRSTLRAWTKLGAVAATVVVFGTSVYAYWRPILRQQYIEEAVAHHAKRLPMEIQTPSPEKLSTWFGGKLNHPVHLPKLTRMVPTGARLLNVKDKQAAYIRYDLEPQTDPTPPPVGVFVFEDHGNDVQIGTSPMQASTHGYQVISWREGDVVYQLVTDFLENDVQQLLDKTSPTYIEPPAPTSVPSLPIRSVNFTSAH